MNNPTPLPAPRMHPALLAAALSVSAFALAGIGVLTGVIPFSPHAAEAPAVQAQAPAATAPASVPNAAPVAPAHAASTAHRTSTHQAKTAQQSGSDIEVIRADSSHNVRTSATEPAVCKDCGVIESVREIAKEGEASGLGAVAGSVVGGILGNQVGAGHGRDAMTVIGAIGGAVAGHQIEKSQHKKVEYEIIVRFDDGTSSVMTQDTPPVWHQGDHVKVVGGVISGGV